MNRFTALTTSTVIALLLPAFLQQNPLSAAGRCKLLSERKPVFVSQREAQRTPKATCVQIEMPELSIGVIRHNYRGGRARLTIGKAIMRKFPKGQRVATTQSLVRNGRRIDLIVASGPIAPIGPTEYRVIYGPTARGRIEATLTFRSVIITARIVQSNVEVPGALRILFRMPEQQRFAFVAMMTRTIASVLDERRAQRARFEALFDTAMATAAFKGIGVDGKLLLSRWALLSFDAVRRAIDS